MKKKNPIAERMLPPEKRVVMPPPFEDMLPSGRVVHWRMPDPFQVVAFDGVVPDPLTAATIKLLKEEGSYTEESDPRKFRYDAQQIMGWYAIAGAMLVRPPLDPTVEYGDGVTLGRREIGKEDVRHLYALFLYFAPEKFVYASPADGPERATDIASDRGEVRQDASGTDRGD